MGYRLPGSLAAAAIVGALTFVSAASAAEPGRPVRVAFAGFGVGAVVTWIARDTDLFAKYGLDARTVHIEGAAAGGVQSLLGTDVFVVSQDVLAPLKAVSEGADLVFVGAHGNAEDYRFGVVSYVDDLVQLKGKKIGVSGLGRKSDLVARVALRRAGLDPVEDVEMVPIGYSPQRAAAIYRNVVQGAPLVPRVAAEAQRVGIKVIEIGEVNLVTDLLVTTRAFADRNPNLLRRFLMAYVNGVQHFLTERADSMRIMEKYVTLARGTSLEGTYGSLARQLDPLPLPRTESVQALIDAVSVIDSRAKELRPGRVLELDILERLRKTGFVKGLYSEKVKL